ncbi:GNAT family N-acetyltransferase [Microbacterium hominis]|uniref:GNAT family N-acetyltransferase n=1 Tax=Microbacterium hominis TaxID=162426 RepID=A0A7D4UHC7_9MICO|nr:GNAT family N-acetyltransferase [Microbacterium hominis]QKJ20769.1 GNAT family N-acetyltransferase [Microbacterium hominis]
MSAQPDPAAGLGIHPLDTVEEVFTASEVLAEVWGGDRGGMPPNLLRALAHAGSYAVGIYDGERMVGASVAFFAEPAARSMHSHITGVLPGHQGRGIGRLLKFHQRDWALRRGVGHVTWTFDPLIARNAHFNLRVLGARVTEYLVNHYGPMDDGVNRGDESDRVMVSWALAAPPAPTPEDDAVVASVAIPRDIEALRASDPVDAASWRVRVREALVGHLADGLVVGGFDDARGYLLVRP